MRVSMGARFGTASVGHARRRLVLIYRRQHPLTHLGHAVVIAGACRSSVRSRARTRLSCGRQISVEIWDIALYRIAGRLSCDPALKNAGILVKLVSHTTKFRNDRTFLFD